MQHPKQKRFFRFIYKSHRYTGLAVAVLVLLIACSGILLNHTDSLGLDRRFINSNFILDWYGIRPSTTTRAFQTQGHWIIELSQQLYINDKYLMTESSVPRGAVENSEMIVIAFPYKLIVTTTNGELVEQIDMTGMLHREPFAKSILHRDIHNIGTDDSGAIYLMTDDKSYYSDDSLLSWQPARSVSVHWSYPIEPPKKLITKVSQSSRTTVLSLERFLLDLHSGRIFGGLGVWIYDIAGILFILLALSGCWIWLHHRIKSVKSRQLRKKRRTQKPIPK